MTLHEVLIILQNRLINLQETRKLAVTSGNLEQVNSIDVDIETTTISIDQLKISLGI